MKEPTLEAFLARVKRQCDIDELDEDPCWEWRRRYAIPTPVIRFMGEMRGVRRVILYLQGRLALKGTRAVATARCGNPHCVNPDHISSTTRTIIGRRAARKSSSVERTARARRAVLNSPRTRLSAQDAADIRASSLNNRELAEHYGVAKSTIARVRRGETWRDAALNPWAGLM